MCLAPLLTTVPLLHTVNRLKVAQIVYLWYIFAYISVFSHSFIFHVCHRNIHLLHCHVEFFRGVDVRGRFRLAPACGVFSLTRLVAVSDWDTTGRLSVELK